MIFIWCRTLKDTQNMTLILLDSKDHKRGATTLKVGMRQICIKWKLQDNARGGNGFGVNVMGTYENFMDLEKYGTL